MESVATLKGELDAIRSVGDAADQEFQRIRETSREAREDSAAATEAVKEIEKKLGPLVQLQELSKTTEERLASLNALAEHVSQKAKALEAQKHAVDRAVVEANRLNEMVWAMDVQIAKLNEGSKQVARAEETVARMEKLAQETMAQLSAADDGARGVRARVRAARQGRPRAVRVPAGDASSGCRSRRRSSTPSISGCAALQACDRRSRKTRMDGVLAKDKLLSAMNAAADELSKDFQTLMRAGRRAGAQAGRARSARRAAGAGRRARPPHHRPARARSSSRGRTSRRCARRFAEFHKSHAEAAQLRDKLSADRAALEAFGERATTLLSRTPELESKMDAVLSKMAHRRRGHQVGDAAGRAGRASSMRS